MPEAPSNGITLHYETFGNPESPALLLIMGLASQMVRWPEEFCQSLADKGLFVIRFDNRDVGLSSQFDQAEQEEVSRVMGLAFKGESVDPPYFLSDMGNDAMGLLDALGIEKAHICGLSMGGMIAQAIAIEHPDRILTLTSMQSSPSSPSDPSMPSSTPEAAKCLVSPPPNSRQEYIEHTAESFKVFSGGSPLHDAEWDARKAAEQFDRGYHSLGVARQCLSVFLSPGRKQALGGVTAPSLVIHGASDTLIPPEHGKATAAAIPGARLVLVEGLGHGLGYPSLWEKLAQEIASHVLPA